jgi:starch synthase
MQWELQNLDADFVFLGSGDNSYENLFIWLSNNTSNIRAYVGYDGKLANKIYAGSDFFLMPSKFEPCGLGQIIAMHYGTLPIVAKVGGLNDTVKSYYDSHEGATGFAFASWDENCFDYSIGYVCNMFYKNKLNTLIKNAMKEDFSWDKQVEEYIKLYKMLLSR